MSILNKYLEANEQKALNAVLDMVKEDVEILVFKAMEKYFKSVDGKQTKEFEIAMMHELGDHLGGYGE